MSPRARLGLLVGGSVPDVVLDLVRELAGSVDIVDADLVTTPDALLVVGRDALGPGLADLPRAVWCPSGPAPLAAGAAVLLHPRDQVLPGPSVALPAPSAGPARPAVGTAVRARVRAARGLPADLVLVEGPDGWLLDGVPVPEDARESALALCSVAELTDPDTVLLALAWGTPVVTDRSTADALDLGGAVAGRDEAAALRADPLRAARLGRAATRWCAARTRPAGRVRGLLGLETIAPARRLSARMDDLGTPDTAYVRGRAQAAVDSLRGPR